MKKELGCLSPSGLLAALLVILAVTTYTSLNGGGLFSPGPLSATSGNNTASTDIRSHVDLQDQCTRCHYPWRGIDPIRCTSCHTNVRDQVQSSEGLHGHLDKPDACTHCHTEHQGENANLTPNALGRLPHQQFGFSLVYHQIRRDGREFVCADCHADRDYLPSQTLCRDCHSALDAAYIVQHVMDFPGNCLECHDGSGKMRDFDHNTVFALGGAHSALLCSHCHVEGNYAGLSADCQTCHEEPDVHLGLFGTQCATCHTTRAWIPARLVQHAFPLDHGGSGDEDCAACHPVNYVTYSCYSCHEHNRQQIEQEHLEEEIRDFENCIECHPTG
jgi:hypothetical protein